MKVDVSQDFDPYLEWLGIPASEQPPDYYRLLGVSRFESDAKILRAAADQRFVYLRTFQLSPHSRLAERLLNEVAAAKICLLAPEKKAAYDAELRDASGATIATLAPPSSPLVLPPVLKEPPPAPPPIQPQPPPLFTIDSAAPLSSIAARVGRGKHAQKRHMARTVLLVVQIVLGGIFGLAAGCFLLSLAYPNHPVLIAVKGFFHAQTTSGNGSEDRSHQPSQQRKPSRDHADAAKTAPPRPPSQAQTDIPTALKEQVEDGDALRAKTEHGEADARGNQGIAVVATLEHHAKQRKGRVYSLKAQLLADGHVTVLGQPAGTATWETNGSTLTIRWNNRAVDVCTVSKDGRSYDGHSQLKPGIHVWGEVLSGHLNLLRK